MPGAEATGHRIAVGLDGSQASVEAVRWAARQAGLTGATLELVTAWSFPVSYGAPSIPDVDWASEAEAIQADGRERAQLPTEVAVTSSVLQGHPADVLVARSVGADLLVVGSRGHGGFVGMHLGSISNHVVAHSACPVVVIRHQRART